MKSCFSLDVIICAVLVVLFFVSFSAADLQQTKNRRAGGTSGLYAFPRVGRSDPSLNNGFHDATDSMAFESMYPVGSIEDYEDYPKSDIKRASLIAFPRVGRNSDSELRKWSRLLALQQALDKRTGPSAASGLWFGPRLGKRSVDERDFEEAAAAAATNGQKEQY